MDMSKKGKTLAEFVKLHLHLIEQEYEEEKKDFNYNPKSPNINSLKRQGVLVNNLSINSIDPEFGSYIVEFSKENVSKDYCPLLISNGDIVEVGYTDEGKVNIGMGTVMHIGKRIRVSLDEEAAKKLDYEKICYIVKTSSEITYKRTKSALQNLLKMENSMARCHMIIEHVFNNVPLETDTLHPIFYDEDMNFKFTNDHLHHDQKEAVMFALKQKNLAIIHGPPGTGKTTTLVEIISQLVRIDQKVLVCAPSNIAVDTILEKLSSLKNRVLRIGRTARMIDSVKNFSLDAAMLSRDDVGILKDAKSDLESCKKKLKEGNRDERYSARELMKSLRKEVFTREEKAQRELMLGASVVLTTLTSAGDDGALGRIPDQTFDIVIIDECSQAIEAACWIAIPKAPKLILAGDHLQLPPTVKSKEACERGLSVSLMERAIGTIGEKCYKLLTLQFRMHLSIMNWVSKLYDDKLKADESVANRLLKDLPGVAETDETDTPLYFIDTAGCKFLESEFHGSKCNENEANIVCVLIKRLVNAGVKENVISVITPYSLQVSCINKKLKYPKVEVRTVDGFQGREKEAIIISLVRSNREKELGFVADKRRLNVAVSRAKCFLAMVGDSSTVGADDMINSLFKHIRQHGVVLSAHEIAEEVHSENLVEFVGPLIEKTNKVSSTGTSQDTKKDLPLIKSAEALRELKPKSTVKTKSDQGEARKKHMDGNIERRNLSCNPQKKVKDNYKNKGNSQRDIQSDHSGNSKKSQELAGGIKPVTSLFQGLSCTDSEGRGKEIEEPKHPELAGSSEINEVEVTSTEDNPELVESVESKAKKTNRKRQRKNVKKHTLEEEGEAGEEKEQEKQENESDKETKYLEDVIKKNSRCSMMNCKTDVTLISHYCEYCRKKFCLSHMLPEIHGCGEAARRACRHNFKHQITKVSEKEKKIASTKLKKKVAELAAGRKGGSKKKQ